jgi:hypothetical protein
MIINVKLIGLFQEGQFKQMDRLYPDGTPVHMVINDLQLPLVHIGTILVNGVHSDREWVLSEGDKLVILPLLGGG